MRNGKRLILYGWDDLSCVTLLRDWNSIYGAITYSHHLRIEEMKYIKVLSDLRGYKLLTYIGDGWAEKNLADLDVEFGGRSLKEVLCKLAHMRGDILLQTAEVTLYCIKKLAHEDAVVLMSGVTPDFLEFILLIGKQSPFVTSRPKIDKMLTEVRRDGSLDAIYRQYR